MAVDGVIAMVKKFINGIRFGVDSFFFAWEEWQLSDPYFWEAILSDRQSTTAPWTLFRYCLEQEIISRYGITDYFQILDLYHVTTFAELARVYSDCLPVARERYSLRVKI